MTPMFLVNVPLSQQTTYKIGGPAKYFAEATNETDIIDILSAYNGYAPGEKKLFILGGGANVLFSDDGYDGLILKISISEIELVDNYIVKAGAGARFSDVVQFAAEHNLSGIEWAAGIPGSFGGAIRGNAGAFGGEIKDIISSVTSTDIKSLGKNLKRKNEEKIFGYRTSIFKSGVRDEIILQGEIKLTPGSAEDIRSKMEKNMNYRREKHPIEWPSAGSTFKNIDATKITEAQKKEWASVIKTDPVPVLPAGFLISEAGLKGLTEGGAKISEKHSNFFINTGDAKAEDVKKLIAIVKKEIKEKFKIEMEEEIQIVDR